MENSAASDYPAAEVERVVSWLGQLGLGRLQIQNREVADASDPLLQEIMASLILINDDLNHLQEFASIFEEASLGIAIVGLDGSFVRPNPALCQMLGYSQQQLEGLTFQDITHPEDLNADVAQATRLLNGDIPRYQIEKRYYRANGHLIWVRLSGSLVRNHDGSPRHFIAQIEDISTRKRHDELTERRATRDALTGVLNRWRFEEELAKHEALAKRHPTTTVVLSMDIDGLKRVNDERGHAAGDELIRCVARTLSKRLRLSDVFARIGGDEFAAILPHTSEKQGHIVADACHEHVLNTCHASVSIGVAALNAQHAGSAMALADRAMYESKRQHAAPDRGGAAGTDPDDSEQSRDEA